MFVPVCASLVCSDCSLRLRLMVYHIIYNINIYSCYIILCFYFKWHRGNGEQHSQHCYLVVSMFVSWSVFRIQSLNCPFLPKRKQSSLSIFFCISLSSLRINTKLHVCSGNSMMIMVMCCFLLLDNFHSCWFLSSFLFTLQTFCNLLWLHLAECVFLVYAQCYAGQKLL